MSDMGGYIILAFAASQFLQLFSTSNLGIVLSVKGAEFLKNANISGVPLIIGFILLSCLINIFIGSASAKWGYNGFDICSNVYDVRLQPCTNSNGLPYR